MVACTSGLDTTVNSLVSKGDGRLRLRQPVCQKKVIRPEDWTEIELPLPASQNGTRILVERYFLDNGINILPAVEAGSLSLIQSCMRPGDKSCAVQALI